MLKTIAIVLGLLLALVIAFGLYRTLTPPAHLYVKAGSFAGCPARPSCVSSAAPEGGEHYIAPPPAGVTLEALAQAIVDAGGRIDDRQPDYLHAVFSTPRMRFRDDVEVLRTPQGLQWRSVSRFGYRDFGVNRARLEALREQLAARQAGG